MGRRLLTVCYLFTLLFSASTVRAQGLLEVPSNDSSQSGIGIVSGWKCTAGIITVQFDDGPFFEAGYGTVRTDTQSVCGDTNNGWAFLWNWNKLGDGTHTVRAFDNGVQFGEATITVQTLSEEFRTGLNKAVTVQNFPEAGQTTTLVWQQGQQNFVIQSVTGSGSEGICTTKVFDGINSIWTVTNPCQGGQLLVSIEAKNNFFVCNDVAVVQNGTQYDSHNYDWEDEISGQSVCGTLLPGVTKNTILTFRGTLLLDLTDPFSLFFNTQKLFDFP